MRHVLEIVWKWLKGAFTRNIGMKIGALVFAFLLWSFVLADTNPPKEKIFDNIPVSYTAQDVLRSRGLTSAVAFSDVLKEVSVTVEANADRLQFITEETISAEVDLSGITEPGEYTLPVRASLRASSATGSVVRVNPSDVTLDIEKIETLAVPVEVQKTGQEQEGWYYGEPVLASNTVKITGASSNVEKVTKAVCTIDVTGLDAPTTESRTVTLVDENGNELSNDLFTGIPSVIVELPVYPEKTVPVDEDSLIEDTTGVAEGYEIIGVTITPSTVDIAGEQEILDEVFEAQAEPIVLDEASADTVVEAPIALPEGAYAAVPGAVKVQFTIVPQREERVYSAVDVSVKNLGEGLSASLYPEAIDITVSGTKAQLDAFTADQLKPFVDLDGLTVGTHEVEIKFENEPDLSVSLKPSVEKVQVTITAL